MQTVPSKSREWKAGRPAVMGIVLLLALALSAGLAGAATVRKLADGRTPPRSVKPSKISLAQRQEAAESAAKKRAAAGRTAQAVKPLQLDPQGIPDYFGTIPNYATSPLPLNGGGATPHRPSTSCPAPASASSSTPCRVSARPRRTTSVSTSRRRSRTRPRIPGSDYYIIGVVRVRRADAPRPSADRRCAVTSSSASTARRWARRTISVPRSSRQGPPGADQVHQPAPGRGPAVTCSCPSTPP